MKWSLISCYAGALWHKNQQNMLFQGLYQEDIAAVLGQFCDEFITYSLSPTMVPRECIETSFLG